MAQRGRDESLSCFRPSNRFPFSLSLSCPSLLSLHHLLLPRQLPFAHTSSAPLPLCSAEDELKIPSHLVHANADARGRAQPNSLSLSHPSLSLPKISEDFSAHEPISRRSRPLLPYNKKEGDEERSKLVPVVSRSPSPFASFSSLPRVRERFAQLSRVQS